LEIQAFLYDQIYSKKQYSCHVGIKSLFLYYHIFDGKKCLLTRMRHLAVTKKFLMTMVAEHYINDHSLLEESHLMHFIEESCVVYE